MLSKLSSLLFLPLCILAILVCKWWWSRHAVLNASRQWRLRAATLGLALLTTCFVTWAGYRFSIRPLSEVFENPVQDIARLAGVPERLKLLALRIVEVNPPVP